MYYLVLVLLLPQAANSISIAQIESLFGNKACIEAASFSIPSTEDVHNIMLDKQFSTSESSLFVNETTKTISNYFEKSAITLIYELAQYNQITPTFELISEEGPAHKKNYKVRLSLGDESYEGTGSSLKKAQQSASTLALDNTAYNHPPIKLGKEDTNLTPTVVLNNVAMKLGIAVAYHLINNDDKQAVSYDDAYEAYGKSKRSYSSQKLNQSLLDSDYKNSLRVPTEEAQISGPFTVHVTIGEFEFVGLGNTIQEARHDAAVKALNNLEKNVLTKDNVCLNDDTADLCQEKKESLKSPISRIYEAGQKRNLPVEFNIVNESGKSHKRVFVTECKLGNFVTEGEGKSKKESKRVAAEKMLVNLNQLPQVFGDKLIVNGLTNKNKKRKKKKHSLIKSHVPHLGSTFNNMLSFWSSDKKIPLNGAQDGPNTKTSHKNKMLQVGNLLNIEIQFSDFKPDKKLHYSLMTLGLQPPQVCLGVHSSQDRAQNVAALNGLKFLYKNRMLDKFELSELEELSDYFNDVEDGEFHEAPIEEMVKIDL